MKTHPLYLNGKFVTTETSVAVINPATEEEFARISTTTRDVVSRAISDAHDAFAAWREMPAKSRADILLAAAREMERRSDEIARTMTMEAGKPLSQSKGEVAGSVDHLRWFAEECRRAYGRVIPNQVGGKRHLVIKTPIGVVGAISPWNFPLILAVRKVAPALAAGCPVILKPATQTPLVSLALAECLDAAKIPPGVFQMILGKASEIGDEFLNNRHLRKITFTGSTPVGKKLIEGAAKQVKPLSLELGGHAPAIVFDDADFDRAIEGVLAAKFRNTGQSCIAANRVYVQAGIYDRFVSAFVERVKKMKTGDGLLEGVDIGALIDQKALDSALGQIEDAKKRGARVLTGGARHGSRGFFLQPTVLENVHADSICMSEETFAPVAPIVKFTTEDEAIAQANNTVYGLSAYAFTSNIDRMFRIAEKLEAGTIGINDGVPTTSNAPFGGMKESGWGRELGSEGLESFLETKHIAIGLK
jgi:succinate-semialdehyde dehydrogenase / glutarate-semialdehyde dehydrogenase